MCDDREFQHTIQEIMEFPKFFEEYVQVWIEALNLILNAEFEKNIPEVK